MVLKTARTGLLAALGAAAAVGAAAGPAAAAEQTAPAGLPRPTAQLQSPDTGEVVGGTTGALGYAVAPVKNLRLDPWAQSSADVLNNGVAVQPDNGVPAVGTSPLTSPLSAGGGPQSLPVVGPALGLLPG
ncbi:hypothetical protein [Kitasatospora sp. DSM 101779]|uniref:hypothetical protein n=1 Tax=Kitasatospora sp. DSM 101779 TaxID=2853165 RepID=UPI0021D95879|nr:hypothetical protein [Kitasatospora sp. DSM 101779]MCU7824154.1 hypothetical protein [Kitasatospora sp. DSM 101779]